MKKSSAKRAKSAAVKSAPAKKAAGKASGMASSAAGVRWNLGDMYKSPKDPAIVRDLDLALKKAKEWEKTYRGRFVRKPAISAAELGKAVAELEHILELRDKPQMYAHLLFAQDTSDAGFRALMQQTQERSVPVAQHLLFWELEWCQVDEAVAKKLIAAKECARYAHYLEAVRRYRPHQLSEAEEKICNELSVTGNAAFIRLFDQLLGSAKFAIELDGKEHEMSEKEVLALLYDPRRDVRAAAAKSLTEGLQKHQDTLGLIMNTLVLEHATMDRLRKYPSPISRRNLSNEISDKTVETLLKTCDAHTGLVGRYYKLKGKLLGLEKLYDYDRYAPIATENPKCAWTECRDTVLAAYRDFSPQMAEIAEKFFKKAWLDAELRPGKRGGAFSMGGVPSVHPYILVNYTDRLRDVMTVAHELGHGVHQYLSRERGYIQSDTPLTLAETASVFGEMLTFKRLMAHEKSPQVRLSLLCSKIEDIIATAFRQVCMTQFEKSVHDARRAQGELDVPKLNAFWLAANKRMFGESVELTSDYGLWWSYIPHFIHTPFYCYAYAFGELLVLALFRAYQEQGKSFVPKYLELLSAGGSEAPEKIIAKLGLDVNSPTFWKKGMVILEGMISEAEMLAAEVLGEKKVTPLKRASPQKSVAKKAGPKGAVEGKGKGSRRR